MTAEQAAKRKWYSIKRVQGWGLVIMGAALTAVPYIPDTVGLTILSAGLYWAGFGQGAAEERNTK